MPTAFNFINTLICSRSPRFYECGDPDDSGEEPIAERKVRFLDLHVVGSADIALNLSTKELLRMGRISQEMLADAESYPFRGSRG